MKSIAGKLAQRTSLQERNRRLGAMLVAVMVVLVAISFIIVVVRN